MNLLGVFVDPGYSTGIAALYEDGVLDLYQVDAPKGWPGRARMGQMARDLGRELGAAPLGVMEIGWGRKGRSRQSSTGLAINAGIWAGGLAVQRWVTQDPSWKNVDGWKLGVDSFLTPAMDVGPDAYDACGVMLHWTRRNWTKRSAAVQAVVESIKRISLVTTYQIS